MSVIQATGELVDKPSFLLESAAREVFGLADVQAKLKVIAGSDLPVDALEASLTAILRKAIAEGGPLISDEARQAVVDADDAIGAQLQDVVAKEPDSGLAQTITSHKQLDEQAGALSAEEGRLRARLEDNRLRERALKAQQIARGPLNGPGERSTGEIERELRDLEADGSNQIQALQNTKKQIADAVTARRRLDLVLADAVNRRYPDKAAALVQAVHAVSLELLAAPSVVEDLSAKAVLADIRSPRVTDRDSKATSEPDFRETPEDRALDLRARAVTSRDAARSYNRRASTVFVFGLATAVLTGVLAAGFRQDTQALTFILAYGLVGSGMLLGYAANRKARARDYAEEVIETQNELDLLTIGVDQPEARAHKLLQVNQFDLKRYYDQTLRQGRNIFYVGISCIVLGFAIVGVALAVIANASETSSTNQVVVAALGAVGGILANFIAVIYLRMYSDTIASVGTFHDRLVGTHDLYFANLLTAMVGEEAQRQTTLADMAVRIATAHHGSSGEPAGGTDASTK